MFRKYCLPVLAMILILAWIVPANAAALPSSDLVIQTRMTTTCAGWTFDVLSVTYNTPILPGSESWSGPTSQSGAWATLNDAPPQEWIQISLRLTARLTDGTPVYVDVSHNTFEPPATMCSGWTSTSTSFPDWTEDTSAACSVAPRYYMYTLEDANQPENWQPYCYIISSNGVPSVENQARICTPPGAEHTFRATNIPYHGWVSADCSGHAYYGWPDWMGAWYRPDHSQ